MAVARGVGRAAAAQAGELAIAGHAIEARIYAEDPARDFLPSIGKLEHLVAPEASATVRVDTGVRAGDEITPFYDPMIAKLIVHGDTRGEAIARMRAALAQYQIVGVRTNVEFLGRLMSAPSFVNAAWIPRSSSTSANTCSLRAAKRLAKCGGWLRKPIWLAARAERDVRA